MARKDLKDVNVFYGGLYHQGNGRVLARALSLINAKEEVSRIHDLSCGQNDIGLYRHL